MIRFARLDRPDESVPLGERGELCISGPNVMKGYWRSPAAHCAGVRRARLPATGDVGSMDAHGYIYIVDRTKDMLLCSGYNVYPRTIEEAIYTHPDVPRRA